MDLRRHGVVRPEPAGGSIGIVIPGRATDLGFTRDRPSRAQVDYSRLGGANPESRNMHRARVWIPGPALARRPGMTRTEAPMHLRELQIQPGHLIRRAQQIAVALFMEECAAFDLTPVQYAALVAIGEHPGIDATRLSALIAFDRSTLGSVIERLEAKRLVARKASREDKRTKLLYLTGAGEALLRDIVPSVDRAQARMLQPLKNSDRKTLLALLTQLVDLNNEASRVPLRAEDALEHFRGRADG